MPFDGTSNESELTKALRDIRALLADPRDFTVGITHRKSANGHIQRCALGAIQDVTLPHRTALYHEVVYLVEKFASYRGMDPCHHITIGRDSRPETRIAGHNNALGHAATLQMFDNAITESERIDAKVA